MSKKTVVRIHFMDGAVKGFGIEEETTISQFKQIIVEKLELKDHKTFGIFEKKGSIEQILKPDLRVIDVMKVWAQEEGQAQSAPQTFVSNISSSSLPSLKEVSKDLKGGPSFVFRKIVFFRNESFTDPMARNLTFIQLLHDIVESIMPCSVDDAVQLAGIQFQVIYGDHKGDTHAAGFIEDKIKEYIPKNLLKDKKNKEWEALILKSHQKYSGKSTAEAEMEYINFLKKSSFYGTDYFSCKNTTNKRFPDKLLLGVNSEGIIFMKKDQEVILTCPWVDLVSWAGSPEKHTISLEILTREGTPVKHIFETKQVFSISNLIGSYVDVVLNQTFEDIFH